MENAYVRPTQDVLNSFQVTEQAGLSESQVAASREKHGTNGMPEKLHFVLLQMTTSMR